MNNEDEATLVDIEDVTEPIDPTHEAIIYQAKAWSRNLKRLDDEIYGMETTLKNLKERREADARYLAALRESVTTWPMMVEMIGEKKNEH